jgi:superoxide dismutase, Fe-Mn family
MDKTRRTFIKTGAILSTGTLAGTHIASGAVKELVSLFPLANVFELPPLGYAYNALDPFFDAQTMQIHHNKHHQAYVTKLNEIVDKVPALQNRSLESLIKNIESLPEESRNAVRNHGGGHWNHSFFWTLLQKNTTPSASMTEVINKSFGSMEGFKKGFDNAAMGLFGSGWAWVIKGEDGKLSFTTTPNQDNPLMDVAPRRGTPIIGLDVWEHAYYLRYQNKRVAYVQAFWNVLNWNKVEELYNQK